MNPVSTSKWERARLTRGRVVGLRGFPGRVIDYVTREESKSGIGGHGIDGLIHAGLETQGRVALMLAVGAGGRCVAAGCVVVRIRPVVTLRVSLRAAPQQPHDYGKGERPRSHLQHVGLVQFVLAPGV